MIDFRYHLVSLIAVFLAVALGIVVGTTQLNGGVLDNLHDQVSALEHDKRTLEDGTQQLQAQQDADDAFTAAVAPALVGSSLAGSSVLLVVNGDGVPGDMVDGVSGLVKQAGGTVSGTLRLAPEYSDPATASTLNGYVTGGGLPAGVTLPPSGDTGQLVATLLADVLMIPPSGTAPSNAAISSVIAGLGALDVLAVDSNSIKPANYAVLLTAGTVGGSDADARNNTVVALAAALDAAGSGTVIGGDTASAGDNGVIGVVRSNPAISTAVSTVDNADTSPGQISTVLALSSEGAGTSGKYGTGSGTQPVPPLPARTP